MTYSIAQVAKKTGISVFTLRYYDKEGLMPYVDKSESGIRMFKDSDLEWISLITCLKATGMHIREIRSFIDLCMQGDMTLEDRLQFFFEQEKEIERQLNALSSCMEKIRLKIVYYQEAIEAGTEAIHSGKVEEFRNYLIQGSDTYKPKFK